jgi:hypothetical protein
MKEKIVEYRTASLAKSKGFNWEVFEKYKDSKSSPTRGHAARDYNNDEHWFGTLRKSSDRCSAPTQSLLQGWLRNTRKIHIRVDIDKRYEYPNLKWYFEVQLMPNGVIYTWNATYTVYDTYEQALEAGLVNALSNPII